MGFSQKEYFTIQFNGCVFALQKLSVTWQSRGIFFCIPFLAIVVQSVTTDSDALWFFMEMHAYSFLIRETKSLIFTLVS